MGEALARTVLNLKIGLRVDLTTHVRLRDHSSGQSCLVRSNVRRTNSTFLQ